MADELKRDLAQDLFAIIANNMYDLAATHVADVETHMISNLQMQIRVVPSAGSATPRYFTVQLKEHL